MKRKLNYTGRRKIKIEHVSITFIRQNGKPIAFTVDNLNLNDLNLPFDAEIYVEANYRTELKRFYLGTPSKINNSSPFDLSDMAYPENLKFRILVEEPSNKKLLAHVDRISPDEPAKKKAILPVEFSDIGNQVWKVVFDGDEGSPILIFNKRINDIQNITKYDAQFHIYVYPAVIREIITHMVFIDGIDSIIEPSFDWHCDWLKFVKQFNNITPEILVKDNQNFDNKETLDWINNTVESFSNKFSKHFQEYIQKLEVNS